MRSACSRRHLLWLALIVSSGLAASGCALFTKPPGQLVSKAFKLPTIRLPPNAIQLDIVYIERPIGDARLGEELWNYADEIVAIEHNSHRDVLRKNGFRVGVVGSNPPLALQQMLRERADFRYEPEAEMVKGLAARRSVVMSGGRTDVQTSQIYRECTIDLPSTDEPVRRSFTNVVCKYRITAERLHEGWVKLDFVPQINHGEERLRPVADGTGWGQESRQEMIMFFPQRFEVKLGVGEMVLVTANETAKGSLGELFFRGPQALALPGDAETAEKIISGEVEPPTVQRLLVVRVASVADGNTNPTGER